MDFASESETAQAARDLSGTRSLAGPAIVVALFPIVSLATLAGLTYTARAWAASRGLAGAAVEDWVHAFRSSPLKGILTSVIADGMLLAIVLLMARRTKEGAGEAIGWLRGNLPARLYPAVILVGLFVGIVYEGAADLITMARSWGMTESGITGAADDMAADLAWAWVLALVLCKSLLPPLCEEVIFRGYVQRRLVTRWGPGLAIGTTALLFGAAHLLHGGVGGFARTFVHGLWVGYLAWRTGSIFPALACHVAGNAAVMIMNFAVMHWPDAGVIFLVVRGVIFVVGLVGCMYVVRAVERAARRHDSRRAIG